MTDKIEKLKAEITRLEELIDKDHFASLVDKSRSEKNRNRLKKLQKELKKLEEEA
jgi:valyl-tRNA synthetase